MSVLDESLAQLKSQIQVDWVHSVQRQDPAYIFKKRAEVASVLKAYSDLSEAGKAEFTRQLNRFNSSDYAERLAAADSMNDILNRMDQVQRIGSGCPCCGYKSE